MPNLTGKMAENLLFFFSRAGSENYALLNDLLSHIEKNDFVRKGEVKDIIMLMAVMNQYKIDNKGLWVQIEKNCVNTFMKQQIAMPADQLT